jgi:hypothetical protein
VAPPLMYGSPSMSEMSRFLPMVGIQPPYSSANRDRDAARQTSRLVGAGPPPATIDSSAFVQYDLTASEIPGSEVASSAETAAPVSVSRPRPSRPSTSSSITVTPKSVSLSPTNRT